MRVALLLLAAQLLLAQGPTTVPPSMLRESSALDSPPSEIKLYAGDMKGNLFRVRPGAGLTLRSTAEGWVIEAASAAPPCLISKQLERNVAGHYLIHSQAVIHRNGILMLLGADYLHNGAGVMPRSAWAPEDLVVAVWIAPCPVVAEAKPDAPPTIVATRQVRNWDQVSARGIAVDERTTTAIAPAQLSDGPGLLWPSVYRSACRWKMDVVDGVPRLDPGGC